MQPEEIRDLIEKNAEKNNPINILKSGWFLIIAAGSFIVMFTNLQAKVEANANNHQILQEQLKTDLAELKSLVMDTADKSTVDLQGQEQRFQLYVDALASQRRDFNAADAELQEQLDVVERDVLLIKREIGLN